MSENTLEASRGARHGSAPGLPTTASPHTRSHTEPEALSKTRERRRCHSRYTRRSNLRELAARQVLLKRTQLLQTRPCLPHRAAGHSRYVRAKTRAKLPTPKRGRTWSPALTRAPATPRPHQPPCSPAGLPHPHHPPMEATTQAATGAAEGARVHDQLMLPSNPLHQPWREDTCLVSFFATVSGRTKYLRHFFKSLPIYP